MYVKRIQPMEQNLGPETNLHKRRNLIHDRGGVAITLEMIAFMTNDPGIIGYSHRKIKLYLVFSSHYLNSIIQINFVCMKTTNMKSNTLKLFRHNHYLLVEDF